MDITTGKYKHYKGREYEVIDTVIHSETLEKMVLYKPLYTSEDAFKGKMWVRPAQMFGEMVTHNGNQIPRFEKLK